MSATAQAGNNFDELLKSLKQTEDDAETLAKSTPAVDADAKENDDDDDAAVAAAAAAGGAADDAEGAADDGQEFGKSLGADEDGNPLVDATELVKSLMDRQDTTDGVLAKAMASMASVMGQQNELIKSMQGQIAALAGQGRGRKAVLAIHEKPNPTDVMAKSHGAEGAGAAITPADLLAKADAAYQAGRITGAQANTVDVCLRNNWPIEPGILQKIAAA